mmetsp:Transcript_25483/g.83891  ORF Transcript_25483/g.83891 Transcript_25483/m.83891 type:complete len:116 (+) Transcript_25483:37-384(+)
MGPAKRLLAVLMAAVLLTCTVASLQCRVKNEGPGTFWIQEWGSGEYHQERSCKFTFDNPVESVDMINAEICGRYCTVEGSSVNCPCYCESYGCSIMTYVGEVKAPGATSGVCRCK